jgi:antitoxin HigA-1
MARKLPPVHPGEILREEFLVPLKLTPYAVAAALNVPRTRIERNAREEKPVTADTALRLGKFFKSGAAFWMNIQARFDLETAEGAHRRSGRSRLTRRRESNALCRQPG